MSLINDSDYLQQMLNKFVEVRLPLQKPGLKHNIYYSQGKTTYKLGCNSSSISVTEKENYLIYTGFIKFQTHHNYLLSPRNWTYNLLALQNYQILDLSKTQVFDGIEYAASAIFYKLEMPAENWKLLVRSLEKQKDLDEKPKLYARTLSIFFDPTIVNSSNYKKIERNGERHLQITIYSNCFIFKPEVYWLPEAGLPIEVKVVKETTEHFGFCGADKLYPVTEVRLHYWSTKYSAKSFYPNDTLKHKIGNKSVAKIKENKPQGFWSSRLAAITEKRNRQMRNAVNKAARIVVNHCIENKIGSVVFGWNAGQKDSSNMGKKNNQSFCQIPTAKLKDRITQLCEQYGIDFIETEESYTSKTSFLDNDVLPTFGAKPEGWKSSGTRITRGQFKTSTGIKINADCNGAVNIIRKVAAIFKFDLSGVGRGVLSAPKKVLLWTLQKSPSIYRGEA